MKAFLMHRDRDFDVQQPLPWNEEALTQDLELGVLFRGMAGEDGFLVDVARRAVLSAVHADLDTITYRQAVLKDSHRNPEVVRKLYGLAVEALAEQRKHYFLGILSKYPSSVLNGAIEQLELHVQYLERLAAIARVSAPGFDSDGFTRLFAMIERELSDEYLATVRSHLAELKFRRGVLVSAELGEGNRGTRYVLRKERGAPQGWLDRVLLALKRMLPGGEPPHVVRIAPRDEAGGRALSELRDRGIASVANAVAQSAEHIQGFFATLRAELAFYVGCLNLHERLGVKGQPVCFPVPGPAGERTLRFSGLYDPSLALSTDRRVVGNAVDLDGKSVVVITGANQGGKSTFLRSVGLAQLMMQCGMFVGADSYAAGLCSGVFTHYKREEDPTMKSGKLDEELARLSDIADHLAPNSALLLNESFAATNEREGSEIARQVVTALLEKGIKVLFVTHLYQFARGLSDRKLEEAVFLRAEREADGTRTFRLVKGEPLETSYGADLYETVFAREPPPRAEEKRPRESVQA
jgi:hypothetical protein